MAAKEVKFSDDARTKMMKGVNVIANAVKVTLGFVELAAALKFLSNADLVWGWNLLSRTLVIALWIVIFFLAGRWLSRGATRLSRWSIA